jgi:hypothetical protein
MNQVTRQNFGFMVVILLTFVMLFVSKSTNDPTVIFPEIAGVAVGITVFRHEGWLTKPIHVWLATSLGALFGTGLNYFSLPLVYKLWVGIIVVVVLLHIFRSTFTPTISAALLPMFLNIKNFSFVISVLIMTFIVMVIVFKIKKTQTPKVDNSKFRNPRDTLFFTILICIWIGLAFYTGLKVAIIPPLFVLLFEVLHLGKFELRAIPSRVLLLTLTSLASVLTYHLLPYFIVLVGIMNIILTLILSRVLKVQMPVAFGVSLMPFVFNDWASWAFPLSVFVASSVLLSCAAAYKQLNQKVKFRLL